MTEKSQDQFTAKIKVSFECLKRPPGHPHALPFPLNYFFFNAN